MRKTTKDTGEKKRKKEEAQNASVTVSTEYTIKCKKKKKKALKKYNKTQVQLRPPTRADELPFVDASYCKSLNSSIASRTSRRPKNKQTKNKTKTLK